MRAAIVGSGLAAVVLLVTAVPAFAVGPTQVQSPFEGSTVGSPTPVVVRVPEECSALTQDTASSVDVRLSSDGRSQFPGTTTVALQRTKACSSGSEYSEWGGVSLDPAQPGAFFGGNGAPMCNGRWRLQARANGGSWGTGVSFQVSGAPAAPTSVRAAVDDDDVTVSWAANPEPDLVGYRVERRRPGGTWSARGSVGAATTSYRDAGVSSGDWEYRVVALRGDGAGATPCSDTQPDLTTPSSVTAASVDEPAPTPTDGTSGGDSTDGDSGSTSGGSTDGDSTSGTSGGGDTTDGAATTHGGDTGGATGDGTTTGGSTDGGSTGGTTQRPSGRRVGAPPPAVRTGPDLSTPDLPAVAAPRGGGGEERFYGEDDEYSPELDFGGVDAVEGTERGVRRNLAERLVPQAVGEFVSRYVDPERVLKPIAAGLVLLTVALHLRRWSRGHDVRSS